MVCTTDIVPALMQMKYDDHEFLALEDVMKEPYVSMVEVGGDPIESISQDWVCNMNRARMLGLINIPYFVQLNEENASAKHILACFHGGTLWLDTPVAITVQLILDIMRLPMDSSDPS